MSSISAVLCSYNAIICLACSSLLCIFFISEYKAEVFRHEDYTETVDVYSYAMIFFYMLRSTPPWAGLSGLDAVTAAAVDGERPLIPRNVDERLTTLMKR